MIELDAWEIEDIRRDIMDAISIDEDGAMKRLTDWQICALGERIVEIHSLHVARAIRSSMQAGLKRIMPSEDR